MIKMMILAPRRTGMTHPEFRRYVTEVHEPLVKSVTEVAADIRHCHYNFPIEGTLDSLFGHRIATNLDIVTEAWFDSVEAQLRNRYSNTEAVTRCKLRVPVSKIPALKDKGQALQDKIAAWYWERTDQKVRLRISRRFVRKFTLRPYQLKVG